MKNVYNYFDRYLLMRGWITMKNGMILLLVFLFPMLLLFSCNKEVTETEIPFSGIYALVRAEDTAKAPIERFVALGQAFKELGADVQIKTDYLEKKKNEQPGEYELLFGDTERAETGAALAAHTVKDNEFLVERYENKIVVLAGCDYAYGAAADWLVDRYDPTTGTIKLPDTAFIGTWVPPLQGLTVDGVSLDKFQIVADDIFGWDIAASADVLNERLREFCGVTLTVVSDESETSEHEIVLCSRFVNRDMPKAETLFLADGKLYLCAETKDEFDVYFTQFCEMLFSKEASVAITDDTLSGFTKNEARSETITVTGNSPEERGANLRAAFAEANKLLRATADAPTDITIVLAGGEYAITEPISVVDTAFSSLTVRAADGAAPILTGAVEIPDSAWEKVDGEEYYAAKLDCDTKVRDLFVGGRNIPLAEGSVFTTVADFDDPDDRSDPANLRGIYLHEDAVNEIEDFSYPTEFMLYLQWEFYILQVTGVDRNDTKVIDGQNLVRVQFEDEQMEAFAKIMTAVLPLPNRDYCFMNNVSLLTPGTCVCDYSDNTVYYYPETGAPTGVSYSVTDQLITLQNAKNVRFEGICFTGSACTSTAEHGYFTGQANLEARYGVLPCAAMLYDDCANIRVTDCSFVGLGTNGIQSVDQLDGIVIADCLFDDVSMSAIRLGNSTTKWEEHDANYGFTITNNRLEHIGMEYPGATAIYISHVDGAEITHNTVNDTSYTGISCGWGWEHDVNDLPYGQKINLRHVEIAYNRITDVMRLLHDGGAVYVLGPNGNMNYMELFNEIHHNYASYEPTDTRFKAGYYLDGAASHWYVYDNVIIGPNDPLYAQRSGGDQATHNILCERLYSTEVISRDNHDPDRDLYFEETEALLADTPDALYATYPEAKAIFDGSGCRGYR